MTMITVVDLHGGGQDSMQINTPPSAGLSRRGLWPWRGAWYGAGTLNTDAFEVGRAHDFEVFHILRVVEEEVADTGRLMNAVTRRHQRFLIFVHKASPAL